MIIGDSPSLENYLEHHGVKGMKWGVRRGSDGSRPIARTLNKSVVGDISRANMQRHNARRSARTARNKAVLKSGGIRLHRLDQVANGTANKRTKLRVALTDVSGANIAKNGGLQNAAAVRATKVRARRAQIKKQVKNGQAMALVSLAKYGAERLIDLG